MIRWLPALVFIAICLLFLVQNVHFLWEPVAEDFPSEVPASQTEQEGAVIPSSPAEVATPSSLIVPVVGVRPDELIDTFTQARASGARVHDAIDIPAPSGTPVVAVTSGRIEKLFFSERGGKTIYQRSDDGHWIYYYAHLESYQPGLQEGMSVKTGDAIAAVGSTGNADPAAPHLHFAVSAMAPGEHWYEGRPINPYPLLVSTGER